MRNSFGTLSLLPLSVFLGCADPGSGDATAIGSTNIVSTNIISTNIISTNRIASHRVSQSELVLDSSSALETTPDGRVMLRYLVRCALGDGDVVVAEHAGTSYRFPGLFGLAPDWEHRALDAGEKRLISACMVAHVKAFGLSVTISVRSPGAVGADGDESREYAVYEGTFFGQIFAGGPEMYSCVGDDPEVAGAISVDRALRVCSDPGPECAVSSLGRCRDACDTRTADAGWRDCWAGGIRYGETMSTYLRIDDPHDHRICPEGGNCRMRLDRDEGILDCSEADDCRAECRHGSICKLDGGGADRFRAAVTGDSRADIDCHESNRCRARCETGSSCEIDCKDANECRRGVTCRRGAECLLDCSGAVDCGFSRCDGPVQTCPGDIVVCNRPCP